MPDGWKTETTLEKLAYSIDEACVFLSLSRSTVKELLYEGRLRGLKVGRKWLVPRWAVVESLAADEGPSVAPASIHEA